MVFGGKFRIRRCNSKASYLPSQSREKLNTTDPDHGSYKLTLTSNEDTINQNISRSYQEDVSNTKCTNLPDVLPMGAKMQQSPPPSLNFSPRCNSSNNISITTAPQGSSTLLSPNHPMKSFFHFQSSAVINNCQSPGPGNCSSPYNSPNRTSPFITSDPISPKFMSQSTIDLKKTHIIESKEHGTIIALSLSQSENNISNQDKPLSPLTSKRGIQRTEEVSKSHLEEKEISRDRVVRAELVNTTMFSSAPCSEEKVIGKDTLRENIEKITQLQTKLMSAHLVDNGGERRLLGLSAKTVELKAQEFVEKDIPDEIMQHKSENLVTLHSDSSPSASVPSLSFTNKPTLQTNSGADGLKVMQRTEIILRLNAPTMEAASQTDDILEAKSSCVQLNDSGEEQVKVSEKPTTTLFMKKFPEEIDCDNLSKDLANYLSPTDKLSQILMPKSFKSSSDYISDLYSYNISPRRAKKDINICTPNEKSVGCELIKTSSKELRDTEPTSISLYNREFSILTGNDGCDLNKKKEELVNRLTKTINLLGNEQDAIRNESSVNEKLGNKLALTISKKIRPIEATKFRAYVDDVGHITLLLLSLSGRLARTENALYCINENHTEKQILETKRGRLMDQLEEAKRLKEDIDRRGAVIDKILEKHLTVDEYTDYTYFINMKVKLLVDSREIADRIKLNEEKLSALKDNLTQAEC